MKSCIIPGSFDPVTKGHTELIRVASKMFDKVYVVILVNSAKNGMFTPEEKLSILNSAIEALKADGVCNVEALLYSGLTTDSAIELGADYIVKGVRNAADFSYEYDLSQITRRFAPELETVFIPSKAESACVSSTYVRELIKFGKWDSDDFAEGTTNVIKTIFESRNK